MDIDAMLDNDLQKNEEEKTKKQVEKLSSKKIKEKIQNYAQEAMKTSKKKVAIFLFLSFFPLVFVEMLLEKGMLTMAFSLIVLSLMGPIFLGFLRVWWFLFPVFPLFFYLLAEIHQKPSDQILSFVLVGLAYALLFVGIVSKQKESISISFTKNIFSSLIFPFILVFFSLGLYASSVVTPEKLVSDHLLKSQYIQKIVDTALKTAVGDQLNTEQKNDSGSLVQDLFVQDLSPKIEVLCEGQKKCIDEMTKKVRAQTQEKLSNMDSEDIKTSGGDMVTQVIESQIESKIKQFTSPETLENWVQEKNIPYLSFVEGEKLQKLFIIVIIMFLLTPFIPLLSVFIIIVANAFYLLLRLLGIIKMGLISVKKQVLY